MAENYKSQKMRTKYTDEQCREAKELLDDISQMLSDVLDGEYMSKACRNHGLDYIKVHRLLSLQVFDQCRLSSDQNPGLPQIEPEWTGYERLYRDMFEVGKTDTINYPPNLGETLDYVLQTLTKQERNVLIEMYGLGRNDFATLTLEEVGSQFNLSRERIRQIKAKAFHKLRHPSRLTILQMGVDAYEEKEREKEEAERVKDEERKRKEAFEKVREEKAKELEREEKERAEELAAVDRKNFHENYKILRSIFDSSPQELASALAAIEVIRSYSTEKTVKERYYSDDIVDLDLSSRAYNCLMRAGVKTISEVTELSIDDMLRIKNLGRKCCREILYKTERGEEWERFVAASY